MKQGSKHTNKKRYDPLFSQTIKDAVAKFGVSETYVRNSVKKTETGGISDEIRKYVTKQYASYKAINQN